MGLTLSVRTDHRDTIVRIGGEIDVYEADPLQVCLLQIMRAHTARLLLDLSDVSFMDCAGLRALELTRRRAELRGGSMDLIAASAAVQRILDLTGQRDEVPVCEPRLAGDDTWTSPTWKPISSPGRVRH
jgi:anti-sigma B factor antagonist